MRSQQMLTTIMAFNKMIGNRKGKPTEDVMQSVQLSQYFRDSSFAFILLFFDHFLKASDLYDSYGSDFEMPVTYQYWRIKFL